MLLAGSSLLTLLDDIATLLDDISVMGKLAAKKTAGVLGDDLSLNAQQVSGVRANREFPVVWGVAKGSLINKVILVPLALIISAFIPWAITPLLMIGGAFLCFEGVEKVLHMLEARKHKEDPAQSQQRLEKLAAQDPLKFEKDKIKGAIRTDFILSAEIVAITLGIVAEAPLLNQVLVLSGIALVVTVGVYGLVGVIVKIDDLGYWLPEKRNCSTLAQSHRRKTMKVNDRVTVKTDGGPRRPGVVLAVEEFSEGTMYLVSLEDYPLGIWFFNEAGHQDGIFVEKAE
ncbi:hypothetical protein WP5S18E07_18380 [Escherichia coli]|nr:hypothetical protein WP5S18E07_18380 [Escherichia coli]